MLTIKHFFSKALASLMLAGLCLCFLNSNSYSGCPTSVPDFPLIPWVDGGCYNTTVDGCPVRICFCFRDLSPTVNRFDYTINSIEFLTIDGQPCYGNTWDQIIRDAGRQVVIDNPAHGRCPPCENPPHSPYSFNYRMVAMGCAKLHNSQTDPTKPPQEVAVLCDVTDFCVQGYVVCCDPVDGHAVIVNTGDYVQFGNRCSTTEWVDVYGTFVFRYDVCYHVSNCN